MVEQEPEYLKNQSRRLHALYRRNRRFLNITVSLWEMCFVGLLGLAVIDRLASMGWGYADDLWHFLGFALFGLFFWVFGTLIQKFNLAYVRHTYGPEPTDGQSRSNDRSVVVSGQPAFGQLTPTTDMQFADEAPRSP